MAERKIKWGILGLGKIAHKFAEDLVKIPGAELVSVGSRSETKAHEFADLYGAPNAYGSYNELALCPTAEVIYIATPHPLHKANTLLCLENNKHVLCEKPFAINIQEVSEMVELASTNNLFLMEAIWTRFLPAFQKTLSLINASAIGDVKLIEADFGFSSTYDPTSRLYDPNLGGGALLDIGIYPLFLAHAILGKPNQINALAIMAKSGVDESITFQLKYENGALANLFATVTTDTLTMAKIYGNTGHIEIPTRWHEAKELTLHKEGEISKFEFDSDFRGFAYEIMEVNQCLLSGLKQSDLLPLNFSLDLMETMDQIRAKIGLLYPGESNL